MNDGGARMTIHAREHSGWCRYESSQNGSDVGETSADLDLKPEFMKK